MHVHPEIAALRGNRPAQRRVQAAMVRAQTKWRARAQTVAVAEALELYGTGAALEDCPALNLLTSDLASAKALVAPWIAQVTEGLRAEPLGEVPHRYRVSPGLTSVQLLRAGRATLSLLAFERRSEKASDPQTVLFQDREATELVIAGSAHGTAHRVASDQCIATHSCHWKRGDIIVSPGPDHARQIIAVDGAIVLLQLSRIPQAPGPSREHRLTDGALVHSASGDKAASQRLMALAVLGALEHAPAITSFTERARDRSEDADVRWEAVRQSLALDPRTGFALLEELQRNPSDPLASPAATLHRQLAAHRTEAA